MAGEERWTLKDICRIFDVTVSRVWQWQEEGVFPRPRQDPKDRRVRFWLRSEIEALTANWPKRPPRVRKLAPDE